MGLLYELATEIDFVPPISKQEAEEIFKAVDEKIKEYYKKEKRNEN